MRMSNRTLASVIAMLLLVLGAACGSRSVLEEDREPPATPSSTPAASTSPAASSPVYLALGDSLAVGVGASDWPSGGYVPRLFDELNRDRPAGTELELINVGRSGADTVSMIGEGQLAEAVATIEARRETPSVADDVEVITVGVGGNDAFGLVAVCGGVIDETCLDQAQQSIRDVRKNLVFIVDTLRAAAGPDTQIAVMSYYNPLIHEACPLHEFELIGDVVLEGEAELGISAGLNDEIRAAAEAVGVPVAEVGQLTIGELTGDCLHASDAGHARIAAAFAAVLNS